MVDPQNASPALEAFSYKQLLHEPIVGGGIWTALVVPFVHAVGIWPPTIVACTAILLWALVYRFHFRAHYRAMRACNSSAAGASDPLIPEGAVRDYGTGRPTSDAY